MGLFHRNENDANFAGGSRNIVESIQRHTDVDALIYLDPRQDFNTGSVITVAPNEQAIFIKDGEIYGVLPSGRHSVATENYAVLSRIRNMLSGGVTTFTCQVYHVSTSEIVMLWGASDFIQCQDFFLGNGVIGVPTSVKANGKFRLCFNINEDDSSCVKTFMKLMGNKSSFGSMDLDNLFSTEITQKICVALGKTLTSMSRQQSINAIAMLADDIVAQVMPSLNELFADYGLSVVNFSLEPLVIVETDERKKYMDRLIAAANVSNPLYNMAVQQELLKDVAVNPGAGGVASAGAGLGMGMAAGSAFATMASTAFNQVPQQQAPPQTAGFGGANRFGGASQQETPAQPDPMETLAKMKKMLEAGLISQQQYDDKVAEVLSRM